MRDYNDAIEALNLAKHNILTPQIITPQILLNELIRYSGNEKLLLEPNQKNILTLYHLIRIDLIFHEDNIIFALRIPLVTKIHFELFRLIPLPIQHQNTSIFSYIEPKAQYLLLSLPKTQFTFLQGLSECNEYSQGSYVCFQIHTIKATDASSCEIQLLSTGIHHIPQECTTRTIKADIESWTYVSNNRWIYVLQKPVTITIVCQETNKMEDLVLHQTGILGLRNQCKGYTNSYILQPTDYDGENITYYVPATNIIEDDCCLTLPTFNRQFPTKIQPINFKNIDLNELNLAQKKLNDFDDILSKHINEPFIVTHTHWYTMILCVLGAIIAIIILTNCCRWFGCFYWIKRLCCFTKSPQNGEVLPPVIRNFVNCNFNSDLRREYKEATREIRLYERTRPQPTLQEPALSEIQEVDSTIIQENVQDHQLLIRSRRSTTPL